MNLYYLALSGAMSIAFVGTSLAGPTPLNSQDLDRITAAGSTPAPNGGAIVGNGSTANLLSAGEVRIEQESQSGVRALNFINSSESTVANGVNLFDGGSTPEISAAGYEISQSNVVTQDQRRLSSLPSYERGANTETLRTNTGSYSSETSSSLYDQVTNLEQHTTSEQITTEGGFSLSEASTFSLELDGDLELGAGDPVFDGNGSYAVEFNAPSASKAVGVVFNGELNIGVDAGNILVDTGDAGITVDIGLPQLDLDFDAMGCVALNGSCTINGSRTTTDEQISDHSTLYTLDESSSTSKTWDKVEHEIVSAPFTLKDAQAEYIVVDESSIDVNTAYLVSLSGGAQSGLRAMNLVNAAGSAVANGVNIATSRGAGTGVAMKASGPQYSLNQTNVINHSR
ncbi:hypothetical protein NLU14_12345 [Marinobacter sp. 71-i]|uniref:Uncharacterized protein n=1 Tax=Marinobacter iranensis TaxID=2962607 RepID=A0ABT5YDD0_9GAMM|nr:hypothetical protein [Marinobacter iranensis]MDF0751015.1 hypothetical protein [Marinobacter iranensis]